MSPMWSSFSNGNRVGNAAFTRSLTPLRLLPAGRGLKPRLAWLSQKSLFAWVLPRLKHYSVHNSKSANSGDNLLNPRWHLILWQQFIHPQFYGHRTTKRGTSRSVGSSMI